MLIIEPNWKPHVTLADTVLVSAVILGLETETLACESITDTASLSSGDVLRSEVSMMA
jgi:hypothetical protein